MTIPEQQKPLMAVGIDWDDTLTNTHGGGLGSPRRKALMYAFEQLEKEGFKPAPGITPDSREKGETDEAFLKRAFGSDEAVAKGIQHMHYYYEEGIYKDLRLIDGARETLRFLRDTNIPFFIATNGNQERAEKRFKHFFGDEFPEVPVIGKSKEHGVPEKPDPTMLLKGFERLGLTPGKDKVWMGYIGDNLENDVTASLRAGVHPVLLYSEFSAHHYTQQDKKFAVATKMEGNPPHPVEVEYEGKKHPVLFAANHQQLRHVLFTEKDKHVTKDNWWEGMWWNHDNIVDGVVGHAHKLAFDTELKQHHLVMIGGSTEWLAYTAFQISDPKERMVLSIPFSTKKSPAELKRDGFADEAKRVARFVLPKGLEHDEHYREKELSYRKMLDLYHLTPEAMVKDFRDHGHKYALIDCVGKGKGLATFVYFMVQWAQEEAKGAQKNDPKFLDDFMASITPVAIAAEPHYRHHYTKDYMIFKSFTVEGGTLPGNKPIPVITYVDNIANMLGFCKYPRMTPKYPYQDWSDKPYFRDDLSWLEENLINEVMGKINKGIERAHDKRLQPADNWADYVKRQDDRAKAGGRSGGGGNV